MIQRCKYIRSLQFSSLFAKNTTKEVYSLRQARNYISRGKINFKFIEAFISIIFLLSVTKSKGGKKIFKQERDRWFRKIDMMQI